MADQGHDSVKAYFPSQFKANQARAALSTSLKVSQPEITTPVNGNPWLIVISLGTSLGLSQQFEPSDVLGLVDSTVAKYDGTTQVADR